MADARRTGGAKRLAFALVVLAATLSPLGCNRAAALGDPAALGYDADAARAWQVRADAELLAEVSPLSAVAAYYVDPGETLNLALEGDALVERRAPGGARVSITAEPGAATIVDADGRRTTTTGGTHPVGRFVLSLGPQSGTTRVVVHDPDASQRRAWQTEFDGRRNWFPVDAGLIVAARLRTSDTRTEVTLPTTRGLTKALPQVGTLRLVLGGQEVSLDAFESGPDAMLVPFTDPTNGRDSYPVGRYVTVQRRQRAGASDVVVVDFNRATNPWCAYSEHYNCPIPPQSNALPGPVRAGEGLPHAAEPH